MATHKKILTYLLIFLPLLTQGQISIVKFVPGDFLNNQLNTVILYNNSKQTLNLKEYFIITRDYALRIDRTLLIKPKQRIAFVKKNKHSYPFPVYEFSEFKDFLIRIRSRKEQGNYVALLNPNMDFVEGFYFATYKYVNFLPEVVKLITYKNKMLFLNVPGENHPNWTFFPSVEDPIIGYEKINDQWKIIPADPAKNLLNINYFSLLKIQYTGKYNLISAVIHTSLKDFKGKIILLKSTNKNKLKKVETLFVNSAKLQIKYYDTEILPDQTYYYQLVLIDNHGHISRSPLLEVKTKKEPSLLEIVPKNIYENEDFFVLLKENKTLLCRILLFSEKWEFQDILFNDYIKENLTLLIPVEKKLKKGTYYILVELEKKRILKRIVVK